MIRIFLSAMIRIIPYDEERWNGIGCINGMLVLVTNFTERERTRIISAQRADNVLTEVYYDYIKKING